MPHPRTIAMELPAQAEDAGLSTRDEESREEPKHNQHPNVHREPGNNGAHGGQGQGVPKRGYPAPSVRQKAHGMRAEDDAQEAGGGQDALLIEGRLEVALHLVHDQADAHDLHHHAHEDQAADEEELVVEASHAGQGDGLLEGVRKGLLRWGFYGSPNG